MRRSSSRNSFLRYMYSAFSERSPSAAAAASARVTSARRRQSVLSSACRRAWPAGVIYGEALAAGGRQRPITGSGQQGDGSIVETGFTPPAPAAWTPGHRSEEHTSELQS